MLVTVDTQMIPPKILGFWIRVLRHASNLSQDALAETAGLTIRTIQRVEAGARASRTTRRCLARGLRYENVDIFDDPSFVATVIGLIDTLQEGRAEAEEARYPDHLKLEAVQLVSGSQLAGLVGRVSAWAFNCDDEVAMEVQAEAAALFDNLQDYLDIWDQLSHRNRLETHSDFDEWLASLIRHGSRVYHAVRETRIVGANWGDNTPLAVTIGYVSVLPEDREVTHLMVPKRSSWA